MESDKSLLFVERLQMAVIPFKMCIENQSRTGRTSCMECRERRRRRATLYSGWEPQVGSLELSRQKVIVRAE